MVSKYQNCLELNSSTDDNAGKYLYSIALNFSPSGKVEVSCHVENLLELKILLELSVLFIINLTILFIIRSNGKTYSRTMDQTKFVEDSL